MLTLPAENDLAPYFYQAYATNTLNVKQDVWLLNSQDADAKSSHAQTLILDDLQKPSQEHQEYDDHGADTVNLRHARSDAQSFQE
jgi:hypothetical protein